MEIRANRFVSQGANVWEFIIGRTRLFIDNHCLMGYGIDTTLYRPRWTYGRWQNFDTMKKMDCWTSEVIFTSAAPNQAIRTKLGQSGIPGDRVDTHRYAGKGAKAVRFDLGDIKIFFSYEDPIAVKTANGLICVEDTAKSSTVKRHISKVIGTDEVTRVTDDELLDAIVKAVKGFDDPEKIRWIDGIHNTRRY